MLNSKKWYRNRAVKGANTVSSATERKPEWLKIRLSDGFQFNQVRHLMRDLDLHTVCEEARCPNIHECWQQRTATFMILGSICTRACRFCAVATGRPTGLDLEEPLRVAEAVARLNLKHTVITSVARDDLEDGGAELFARTIAAVRERVPGCTIEVLIPDFQGEVPPLRRVVDARPDILNHNIETVERLTPMVRSRFRYERSLELLRRAKEFRPEMLVKSGFMVGLGEELQELKQTFIDLKEAGVDIVTVGQYLRPTKNHLPVHRYYTPEEFDELKGLGESLGIPHVEAGPLVRSSYHARDQLQKLQR